jgi:hypothetical protein
VRKARARGFSARGPSEPRIDRSGWSVPTRVCGATTDAVIPLGENPTAARPAQLTFESLQKSIASDAAGSRFTLARFDRVVRRGWGKDTGPPSGRKDRRHCHPGAACADSPLLYARRRGACRRLAPAQDGCRQSGRDRALPRGSNLISYGAARLASVTRRPAVIHCRRAFRRPPRHRL